MSNDLESRRKRKQNRRETFNLGNVIHHNSRMSSLSSIKQETFELRLLFLVVLTIALLIISVMMLTGGFPFLGIVVLMVTWIQLIVQVARFNRPEETPARYVSGSKFYAELESNKQYVRQNRIEDNKRNRQQYSHKHEVAAIQINTHDSNHSCDDDWTIPTITTSNDSGDSHTHTSLNDDGDESPIIWGTYDIRNFANGTHTQNKVDSNIYEHQNLDTDCNNVDISIDDGSTNCVIGNSFNDN